MPSFLSKLLGRKKTQELESPTDKRSPPTLLDGKFEAVSPTVSPSAAVFSDPSVAQIRGNDKAKDKESPFNLLRYKSRPSSDSPATEKPVPDVPHLSLTLPVTKVRGRTLDVVFEPDHDVTLLNDPTIREKRLSPNEALFLVRACSQVIIERGLETLGIMHPHWHSASLEVQHRLISLYILSLASNSAVSPTSPTSTFESELRYAHSPHDVAAVLRWGLRHLKLDGASFGKESGDWTWYNTFVSAERTSTFPSDAFSKSLIPQLPPAHTELLLATLDIISSLSAHGEANGSSGSRISKFLGLWLLTAERSHESDDWTTFYDRWDRAGRILEHLFLARIRDEAHELPRRLTELVDHYPYASGADAWGDNLLPRPRFTTRDFDALFVRLDTEYIGALKPKTHPLRLIADALRAQSAAESATVEDAELWDTIKKASLILDSPEGTSNLAHTEPILNFSNVFTDETIRLLSLVPMDVAEKSRPTPTFVLLSPLSPGRPRSFSLPDSPGSPSRVDQAGASSFGQPAAVPSLNPNSSTAPTTAAPETPTDWLQFTNQGFGTVSHTRDLVASLWDSDVEVTVPPLLPPPPPPPAPLSRKSSRRAHSRRSSVDSPSAQTYMSSLTTAPALPSSKATLIAKVKLNEAFVDFWADALLDPISKPWLRFVLCQLKPLPSAVTSLNPPPTWLIIEQRFMRHTSALPLKEEVEAPTTPPRTRASSPRPSPRAETSRLSAAFSFSPKLRFGFFTGGSSDSKSPNEKSARLSQVGELGESVKEARDVGVAVGKPKESGAGAKDDVKGNAASAAATAATAGAAAVAAASAVAAAAVETPTEDAPPVLVHETAPSVSASIAKIEEPVGDQPTTVGTPQNGHVQDCLVEEPHAPDPETVEGVHSTTISAPAVQTESSVLEATQPALESAPSIPHLTGVSEGPIPQPEFVPAAGITSPPDGVPVPPEPTPVTEESSTAPFVEVSRVTETAVPPTSLDSTFVDNPTVDEVLVTPTMGPAETPEPTVRGRVAVTSDVVDPVAQLASVIEEPKSADTSTLVPVPEATEDQPIPVLDTVRASDVAESVTPTFEEAVISHVGDAGPSALDTTPPAMDPEVPAQDLSAERIAREEPQIAQPTFKVLEEALPAEQSAPISEVASAPDDEPSLDKDANDVTPVVVGTAETSVESNVLKPTLENPEHPVTKPDSEPSVAEQEIRPSHDSEEPLPTNGPVLEEPTPTNARVDEPVVSQPAVEESAVTPKVDSVEEQLANTSEPEPLVEGASTPALEAIPIVEESVKVAAAVPDLSTVEASVNADASLEAPAPVEAANAATTADALTSETSIPIPAEEEPLSGFEAAPAAETPIETLTSVIDPAPQTDSPITAEIPVGTPAEEPIHAATDATPAETPVESPPAAGELDTPQALVPARKDALDGIPAAVVEESIPAAEADTLPSEIIAEAQAIMTEEAIPVSQESVLADPGDLVEPPAPTMERLVLANEEVAQAAASPMETPACVAEEPHFAEEAIEIPADTPAPMAEQSILVTDEAMEVAETPATEIQAPATEFSQEATLIPAEPEVFTETLVPAIEEQTTVIEETAPAADTRAENPTLVVEEDTSAPQAIVTAECSAETPVPVAEEPVQAAPNANTPAETLAVAGEAIPTAIDALPAPSETPAHSQAPELSETASAPETATHAEAPSPSTEPSEAPAPKEGPLVVEETPSETVPPPAEECVYPIPDETAPTTTEAVPDVDVAPVAEDSAPVSADAPSDASVPVADEPVPTHGQSVSPVAEAPAPVHEEPAPVPEEAVPALAEVEHMAETTPVARESTPTTEEAAHASSETPAALTAPTVEDSTLTMPAETTDPMPGEPVREESAPEASPPTPDAEQPLSQEDPAAGSTEEQAPLVEERLFDQPETVVAKSLDQVVQEPVSVDGEAPVTATEEPVVQEAESVPGAETVAASEVDALAEAPESNGTDAHHADPGLEPEQKPATELDPVVTDETLEGAA